MLSEFLFLINFYLSLCLSPKAGGFSVTAVLALVALFELTFKLLLICLIKSGILTMMIVHCSFFSCQFTVLIFLSLFEKKHTSPEVGAINFTSLLLFLEKIHAWWFGRIFQNSLKGKKDVTCTQLRSQRATAGLNLVIDATPPVYVIGVVVRRPSNSALGSSSSTIYFGSRRAPNSQLAA